MAWTPKNPRLFDIEFFVIKDGVIVDEVKSYFALRKISIDNGILKLNNDYLYQKLLLDQGYWEESLLTAPSDEAFINDIKVAKEMGFNGVRKHQKIEDPRYLYWADQMGFLVWGEAANAYCFSREYAKNFIAEWIEMIERDYNHPCIITWNVPLNESWGVDGVKQNPDHQAHATSLYHLTKSLDQSRPVVSNDGWEHTKTDVLTVHNYSSSKSELEDRFSTIKNITSPDRSRTAFADNHSYENQPIIVSELGGISFVKEKAAGWGYSYAQDENDFYEKYYNIISAMLNSPLVQGFCYTQICDVELEVNGLLTYKRKHKLNPEIIKQINEGKWTPPSNK